ncbi:MAG: hypothetical protein K9N23_10720 [Akkermansiaceae bacterium]|nr:hypothetical protein [Akkermansiaceae bacterium]
MNNHTIETKTFFALAAGLMLAAQCLTGQAAETAAAKPAVELAAPFCDNAILQRGTPVPVWGWSKPAAVVTVEFAGQKKTAIAGGDGGWMVKLDPLAASAEPAEMKIQGTGHTVVLKNLLVGEVWHASGQSNMEWFAGKSMCSGLVQELAKAKDEVPVREFRVDTASALYPQKKATAVDGWKSSRAAGNFSALALSFAYELHKELKVPVGILLTSHSNTRIEAFTERKAIEAHPGLKVDADLIHDGDVCTAQGRAAFETFYHDLEAWQKASAAIGFPAEKPLPRPGLPGIAGQWRGPSQFFNGKIAPVVPYAIRGSIWCQGTSNSADGRIYAARMEALLRGWRQAWNMPEMPFYFTQMQCYGGSPNPDDVGFADIRQAQHLFFTNNRKHVGMVVQTDLNPANPGGIHYQNKLHPGMRLARWALANDYGRAIPYSGPIYAGYKIEGNQAVVSFEKQSLSGGLMVGSKGMEKNSREPEQYVEPARPTPGEKLNHFRLCGKDRKWHAAEAAIVGDTVVVTSKDVPEPVGVQYAYCAVPENSNLYNQAGLPATPFAAIDGKLIFEEDKQTSAAPKAAGDGAPPPERPMLTVAAYYREGVILQRDRPVPVWGFTNAGTTVTVKLGDVTRTAKAGGNQQWSVSFPPMKASGMPVTLTVDTDNGQSQRVGNILVGDVWYLTGSVQLTSEWGHDRRDPQAAVPEAMPLVREFKRNTSASTNPTPRKRGFEVGGDRKYRSFWQTADFSSANNGVTVFAYQFAKTLGRSGVPQGFVTMSSGQGGRSPQMASPLSWTSFAGVKGVTHPAFRARLDALLLRDPSSDVAKKAAAEYVAAVKACVRTIVDMGGTGADMSGAPLQFPAFPEPGQDGGVTADAVPTYAYNWCVSPLTPMAVAGVVWVPGEFNIGYTPADYAAELEVYARSLPATYGQDKVQFLYAQPAASLVKGITAPTIPGAKCVTFDAWPKSLQELAEGMAKVAE